MEHISDHDLERYHLGMVAENEEELARLEEHLLWCNKCINSAEASARYVDAMRVGAILGRFDNNVTSRSSKPSRISPNLCCLPEK
jgi:hypothetical protein